MAYTQETIRLPDMSEHLSPYRRMWYYYLQDCAAQEKRYQATAQGNHWVIAPRRMPLEPHSAALQGHETQTAIPLHDPSNGAPQRRTARHANELLMPLIATAVAVLGIVLFGGYASMADIPFIVLAPIVALALVLYTAYRISRHYEQNGKALEQFMRATHETNGRVNKRAMYRRIMKGEQGVEG